MKATKAIKVCLEKETPWAHDLGPAPGPRGSRKVRLVNVPFMHAKPTWGDVVIVSPIAGVLTWDKKIHEDGGRWTMVIEYAPSRATDDDNECFDALAHACADLEIVCEGAWLPRGRVPGRAYLAVKTGTTDKAVMAHLVAEKLPAKLVQLYPKPRKPAKKSRAR